MGRRRLTAWFGWAALGLASPVLAQTWMADNGNGTYTNPLFFDEFSDPDLIRVGQRLLSHRHHHAHHARAAGAALA